MEIIEFFLHILQGLNPKRRAGKIVWGIVLTLLLVIAVMLLLGELGF
jgi:hypothetical protein